jgi:hypothetical protein
MIGISRVRYIVRDACENETSCEFNVEVKDKDEPHAICDAQTIVTLNDDFFGKVFARSIDDQSFDDCGEIVSMKVRRMDRGTTICPTPADYDDFVKFCCNDVGKSVMVEFQVIDNNGLSNVCMSEVIVQYKGLGPQITCAPKLPVQDCRNFEIFNINNLIAPSISSSNLCIANALTPLIREVGRSIDNCGAGYIDVEWILNYSGVEEVICSERILFEAQNLFSEANINWPADRTVQGCSAVAPTAEEKANLLDDVACSNVIFSEPTDLVFDNVIGFCKKIQRTWTVIDWCRYPANPSARWTYVQTISVTNITAPVFDDSVADILIQDNQSSCRATVDIIGLAEDDCSSLSDLVWTYRLDLVAGSQMIQLATGNGKEFSRILDFGDYRVTFTVTDECGNMSVRSREFKLEDEQAPQINCSSIVRDINADTLNPLVIIELNELISGVTDNCDPAPTRGLRLLNSSVPLTSNITFSCPDLGVRQIEVMATDASGNRSSCIAFVDVRDGNGSCGFGANAITVSGKIMTAAKVAVENVAVNMLITSASHEFETAFDGNYAFGNVPMGSTLSIHADKKNDFLNGVSTLDIVLIQRHILGIKKFQNTASIIAADVNMNKAISSTDLVILRKLLLGQIERYSHEQSWIFIPTNNYPSDISKPYDFSLNYQVEAVSQDMKSVDFVAIKLGDVDNNAVANSKVAKKRDSEKIALSQELNRNKVDMFISEETTIAGFQLSLLIPEGVSLLDVSSTLPRFSPDMVNVKDGKIYVSWSDLKDVDLSPDLPLLSFSFSASVNKSLELNNGWDNQLYTSSLDVLSINNVNAVEAIEEDLLVGQNVPNPFTQQTIIDFTLSEASEVDFSIVDVNGILIHRSKQNYPKGSSHIVLQNDVLQLNKGIYYYIIKTQKRSLIKKMMVF